MIKFIDLKNNYTFDGTSYVKVMKCPKCGYTIKGKYNDELGKICPRKIEKPDCDIPRHQDEVLSVVKHVHPCNTPLVETITGPHNVFWFDDSQSTSLYYIKEICAITDSSHGYIHKYTGKHMLPVSINQNEIFKLINLDHLVKDENSIYRENINGFKYHDINILTNSDACDFEGEEIAPGYYAHIIYILAKSEDAGEFIEDIYIDNEPFAIGADFYNVNEELAINLSNFGFEIPNDIQKAIYTSNIHEDYSDNILINRKLKELLINYWDILANMGSYKSLINSLNWFEWGDIVRIREVWKHDIGHKLIYDDRKLRSILEDKYKDLLSNFVKSTYISLYTSLEKISENSEGNFILDEELNPRLEFISTKWSFNDLSLKMSLLGKFYEEFFMPIHIDLIHSTIEDIVFMNPVKINESAKLDRTDHVYNFEAIECNIPDNAIFYLSDISQPILDNTVTAIQWDGNYDVLEKIDKETNNYYSGAGVIVPIKLKIPTNIQGDFIKSEQISLNTYSGDWLTTKYYHIFDKVVDGKFEIEFNILCTREQDYDIRMQFETASCKVSTINIKFEISDTDNAGITLYKYHKKDNLTPEDFGSIYIDFDHIEDYNLHVPKHLLNNNMQYLPVSNTNDFGLNHVIIFEGDYSSIMNDFFDYYHKLLYINNGKEYTVCISKEFGFEPKEIPQFLLEVMYNNGYRYFSEFFKMSELKGDNIDNYTINDNETLCISTNLILGNYIKEYTWEFENITKGDIFYPIMNNNTPFTTHDNTSSLTPGYYNIIFKYKLVDGEENIIKLNSAFIKK